MSVIERQPQQPIGEEVGGEGGSSFDPGIEDVEELKEDKGRKRQSGRVSSLRILSFVEAFFA